MTKTVAVSFLVRLMLLGVMVMMRSNTARASVMARKGPFPRDYDAGVFASRTISTGKRLTTIRSNKDDYYGGPKGRRSLTTSPDSTPLLETYNCKNSWSSLYLNNCILVSNSPSKINTKDPAVNDAHNHMIDVLDFFKTTFDHTIWGTVRSKVHHGVNLITAFLYYESNDVAPVYGDGDGTKFTYFSKGLDMVAALFTQSFEFFGNSNNGQGHYEPLLIAFRHIMAATVDRLYGNKSKANTWRLFEDIDIDPSSNGYGWFDMAKPPLFNQLDYYQVGLDDCDFVMDEYDCNYTAVAAAGIVSKAFYLMVEGGTHRTSGIKVPALDPKDFDKSIRMGAKIFYSAYFSCFYHSSTLQEARECTLMFAANSKQETVSISKAWDAVGVLALNYTTLYNKVAYYSASFHPKNYFILNETVKAGQTVSCTLQSPNGEYVFGDIFVHYGNVTDELSNGCVWEEDTGMTPYTRCGSQPAPMDTKIYITVRFVRQSMVQPDGRILICFINDSTEQANCKALGQNCTDNYDCCNNSSQNNNKTNSNAVCDGTTPSTKKCKKCKGSQKSCARTSQCCEGLVCKKDKKCSSK